MHTDNTNQNNNCALNIEMGLAEGACFRCRAINVIFVTYLLATGEHVDSYCWILEG